MRLTCFAAAGIAALVVSATATADIVPIGPFAGQFSDDFESYPNYNNGGNTDTRVVAGGAGTFSSNPVGSNQLWIIEPNGGAGWGLGGYGGAGALGEKALGLFNQLNPIDVTLTLPTPAAQLGFYFVTADDQGSTMTVSFFDAGGNQLGNDQILDSLGNVYIWAGWSSATGIATVRFTGNVAPVLDDLQITIPAPAGLLAFSGLIMAGLGRRRR